MANSVSFPNDSLHSYDGAKKPSLQPKEQHSDNKPINNEDNWMPLPLASNCPSGLEYLTKIDKIVVNQNIDRIESKKKYVIKNDCDQKVYTAVEEYNKCCVACCNTTRPFNVRIFDFQEREVLHLHRPLRSQSCCFPCCLQSVQVTASGTLCGFIKQSWSPFSPKFRICDTSGKTVLLIKGPSSKNYVGPKFKVLSSDGETQVGYVSKLLPGSLRRHFINADHFSISFPIDLDVNTKAVLLAASILIDCLYYKSIQSSGCSEIGFSGGFEIGYCVGICLYTFMSH